MKVAIIIDGGAGRVVAAIPALIKYIRNNPDKEVYTICAAWEMLLWGIPEIQGRLYNSEVPHIFEDVIKKCDTVIRPEPYLLPDYFNQKVSIAGAFDQLLNGANEDFYKPYIRISQKEKLYATATINEVKNYQGKEKTIVIQPFGRGVETDSNGKIADSSGRSFSAENYLSLVQKLAEKYNVVFFGEPAFYLAKDRYTYKLQGDLRMWASVIEAADYFVGCDSVGQHISRAVNTKGTVILGSTFAINSTYPEFFKVIEKQIDRRYSPIRISNTDSMFVDHINQDSMIFNEEEINYFYNVISEDIENQFK